MAHTTIIPLVTESLNNETDSPEVPYKPYNERLETYIVPAVLFIIIIVGVTGNGVLVLTILRNNKVKKVPNIYVLSLAVGDLLVILMYAPFTITVYVLDSWPFGLTLCKISEFIKDLSIGVSVFTLTAMSVDRYIAIVNPLRKLQVSDGGRKAICQTILTALLMWILAIGFAIPATFAYIREFRVNSNVTFKSCYPYPVKFGKNYPKNIVICRFIIYYALPLSIITVFYLSMARHLMQSTRQIPGEMQGQAVQVRSRKKVAKMVMTFVLVFAVCFFPQQIFTMWFHINDNAKQEYNDFWHAFRILGFCLAFMNSCINPIALYFVSGTFRKYFNRYLLCYCAPEMHRSSTMNSNRRGQSVSLMTSRQYASSR